MLRLALLCPAAVASAQPASPQEPDPPRRLRLDAPRPQPSPAHVTLTTGSTRGLRTLAPCPTCPTADDRVPLSHDGAPWRIGAFCTVGGALSTVTFGVVGQRNERLPLFMTVPISGPIGAAPPQSIWNATSDTRTHWVATIAAEKTFHDKNGGRTLGVLGDVFLPLGTSAPNPASVQTLSLSGRTVRGALRVFF